VPGSAQANGIFHSYIWYGSVGCYNLFLIPGPKGALEVKSVSECASGGHLCIVSIAGRDRASAGLCNARASRSASPPSINSRSAPHAPAEARFSQHTILHELL